MNNDWDETAFTHVLRYESIDTSNNELTFEDLATGTVEIVVEEAQDNQTEGSVANYSANVFGKGEIVVGGNTYRLFQFDLNDLILLFLILVAH